MPLYEYQCEACEHRFERIQKFSDPPLDACPKCGGPVRKLFSSPAIQFKGSGFYITDYAKKSSGRRRAVGLVGEIGFVGEVRTRSDKTSRFGIRRRPIPDPAARVDSASSSSGDSKPGVHDETRKSSPPYRIVSTRSRSIDRR